MASSGMRAGKCRPSTVYYRRFPGKRKFEKVSKDDWNAVLPVQDIAGWGHVGRLEADVMAYAPDGELQIARKWPSRSYIRNFARIMRNTFGQSVVLVDSAGSNQTTAMNTVPSATGMGLIPQVIPFNTNLSTQNNPELSGLAMAIGQGVAAESHTRNDLVSRVGGIYSSRQNLVTTVFSTSTTTLQVTSGVTNATAASVNITEMGMFLYAIIAATGGSVACVPFATLLAYDGITSTPVASGGVIAPRYTMDFPI